MTPGDGERIRVVDARRTPFVMLDPVEARIIAGLLEDHAARQPDGPEKEGAECCAIYLASWASKWEPTGLCHFADIPEGDIRR